MSEHAYPLLGLCPNCGKFHTVAFTPLDAQLMLTLNYGPPSIGAIWN